ncbi:hypothetical protein HS125_18000 [bacterium]|nr:hypothetical protein [bacterium]
MNAPTPTHSRPRWPDAILVLLFLVLISAPYVARQWEVGPDPALSERRKPAIKPRLAWNWRALAAYPGLYDKYYNDHFGLRGYLIDAYNHLLVRELGVSPKSDVILGKHGWLFYGAQNAVDVYRSPEPFTDKELDDWRWNLLLRREWLARKGIPYIIVIAPDKAGVYPEYLPDWIVPATTESRTDQWVNFMRATTDLVIVDLRGPMKAAKGDRLLYHKADTHWNDLGAFVGYTEMMMAIGRVLPSVQPRPLSDYRIYQRANPRGDLAGMLGMDDFFEWHPALAANFPTAATLAQPRIRSDEWARWRVYMALATESRDRSLPRAVVFNDSYFYGVIPYFAEHFSRAVYVHMRPDRFAPELIEREKPDVVVQELVERWFGRMPDTEETLF